MWIGQLIDRAECRLIGKIVTEVCHRRGKLHLLDNRLHRPALVAAGAQFDPCLKGQKRQASDLRSRLEQRARLLLDRFRLPLRVPAPMHHHGIGLVFKQAAKRVLSKLLPQCFKRSASLFGSILKFVPAVGKQPLRAMQAPYFKGLRQLQHRIDFARGTPCDHCKSRSIVSLNLRQKFAYTRPGPGIESIHSKAGQCAIVVQQQQRTLRASQRTKELFQRFNL